MDIKIDTLGTRILNFIVIITATGALATSVVALFSDKESPLLTSAEMLSKVVQTEQQRLDNLATKLGEKVYQLNSRVSEIEAKLPLDTTANESISSIRIAKELNFRINNLEEVTKANTDILNTFRESFNPAQPEEVLTIVRLRDEVLQIKKDITTLENKLIDRQTYVENSINRELASVNKYNAIILGLLATTFVLLLGNAINNIRMKNENAKTN